MKRYVFLGVPPVGEEKGPQPAEIGRFGVMQPGTIIPLTEREAETIQGDKRFALFDAKKHRGAKQHEDGRLWNEDAQRLQELTEMSVDALRVLAEEAGIQLRHGITKAELVLALVRQGEDVDQDERLGTAAQRELDRIAEEQERAEEAAAGAQGAGKAGQAAGAAGSGTH